MTVTSAQDVRSGRLSALSSTPSNQILRIAVVANCFNDSIIAGTINRLKTADGFAKLGHEVDFISYGSRSKTRTDLSELRRQFALSPAINFIEIPSRFGLSLRSSAAFSAATLFHVLSRNVDFCYCHHTLAAIWLSSIGVTVAAETHAPLVSGRLRRMLKRGSRQNNFRCLVTISGSLKELYESVGLPGDKILVVPDAVDVEIFRRPLEFKRTERDRPKIVYAGHLYDYKGIPDILDAAELLPQCDFELIGGQPEHIERYSSAITKRKLTNVRLAGWVSHAALPPYLWEADVLLLPPSAKHETAGSTSPMKLSEYLISGSPIVATDIGGIRYWVTDDEVLFVKPDRGDALAAGICEALEDKEASEDRAQRGFLLAQAMSYSNRAQAILRHSGFG